MENKRKPRKIADVLLTECVACGCCTKVCPKNAIEIYNGIYAVVDKKKCVGCAKCMHECPASVITMREVSE